MKRFHIIVVTIFFSKMSVTAGVMLLLGLWAAELAKGSKLWEFCGD